MHVTKGITYPPLMKRT